MTLLSTSMAKTLVSRTLQVTPSMLTVTPALPSLQQKVTYKDHCVQCRRHQHINVQHAPYQHPTFHANSRYFDGTCLSNGFVLNGRAVHDYSTLVGNRGQLLSRNSLSKTLLSPRQFSLSPRAVLDASPLSVQPYLRLIRFDKPIGTLLLFWPCTWSIGMAAAPGHLPDFKLLALFGAGAFFMRGAGCIINDMYDRDFDKMVYRTKDRPLACGQLSMFHALTMLALQLSVSLSILLQLNWYSVALGASSMGLVLIYPLAKRYTYWPQVVLGVTLNWGVLLGWSACHGALQWPVLPLYTACVLYTVVYDSIYAHQDKEDDILVGVKSTALRFGAQTKYWLTGFSSVMVSNLALTGYMCEQSLPYYISVGVVGAHLAHQIYTVDLDNPNDCFAKFKSNSRLGVLLFLGIVAGTLVKTEKSQDENPGETQA